MSNIRVEILAVAMSCAVACNADERRDLGSAQLTQDIQIADLVGPSGTGFFPVGFFVDGHQVDVPDPVTGFPTHNGYFIAGAPVDAKDASRYYDETLSQMRSLGMNSFVAVNMDLIGTANDDHLKVLAAKANALGGIYPIPGSRAIQGLTTPPGEPLSADPAYCQSQSDGAIDDAVKATLAAIVESCTDLAGNDTGVFCNSNLCARSNAYCCGASQACTRNPASQALAGFYTLDEPSEACLPTLRQVSKHLGLYDPSHSGFASISSVFDANGSIYRGAVMDKMLAYDHVLYDDRWALLPATPVGDVFAFEDWAARIDDHYVLAPSDKPLYYDIQAGSDVAIRKPTREETRYLTYAALARGVKGIFFYLYGAQAVPSGAGGSADTDYNLDEMGIELRRLGAAVRTLAPWLVEATRDLPRKNGRTVIATAMRTDNGTGSEGAGYDLDITSFTTRTGERLVMLVNEQMGSGDPATIPYQVIVDPGTAAALFVKGAVRVRDLFTNTVVAGPTIGPSLAFTSTLSQGEGKLFQLQSDYSAEVTIPRDGYHNSVAAPKAFKAQVRIKNTGALGWTTADTRLGVHVYAPNGAQSDVLGLSLGANVGVGATTTVTVTIPTGAGTNITQSGTYELAFDLYKVTNNVWFKNEQRISVMVVPPGNQPLLVDTFDRVAFGTSDNGLYKWDRTGLMKIRGDKVAINGGGAAKSRWGASWQDYTVELDVMIDLESQAAAAQAGWRLRAASANSGYVFVLHAHDPPHATSTISVYQMLSNSTLSLVATLSTGPIEKGRWYHIKHVVTGSSNAVITTQIYPVGSPSQSISLQPVNTTNGPSVGGVGFYLADPGFSSGACEGETVGRCTGGPVPGTPCVASINCLGGTCAGEVDNCYPGLERAHFDNVFAYEPSSTFSLSAVAGVTSSAPSYPLTLSWNRSTPTYAGDAVISHYRVYRSPSCSFTPSAATLVAEPSGPVFIDRTPGTYCYKVTAVTFANVESPPSAGVTGQVLSLPTAPSVSAVVNGMKSVTVSWTAVGSAAKYRVYRGTPGFTPSTENLIATVVAPSTSYHDASPNMYVSDTQLGLNGFATYRYAVVPVPADELPNPSMAGLSAAVTLPGSKIFSDGFSGTSANWQPNSGSWIVSGLAYTQSDTVCAATGGACASTIKGIAPLQWPRMGDMAVEFTAQIATDAGTPGGPGFAGFTIRKTSTSDQYGGVFTGYLVYIQGDGTVGIRSSVGLLASKATGLSAMSPAKRRLRVEASGQRLRVFVDGIKYIDYRDDEATWLVGYMDLTTYRANVKFDDVNVFFREGFSDLTSQVDFDDFACAESASYCSKINNWANLSGGWAGTNVDTADRFLAKYSLGDIGVFSKLSQKISNANIVFTVKITDDDGNPMNWAGMEIRKQFFLHRFGAANSGYLIYYRANGQVEIFNPIDGVMATGTAPPLGPTDERKVWIQAEGGTIKVFVGAPTDITPPLVPVVQATDTKVGGGPRWSSGFVDFTTSGGTAEFRKLAISRFLRNWRITSPYGTYDPRWMHQLMIPAPVGQGFTIGPTELKVADFTADFAVRIDNFYGSSSRWAGFSFHKANAADSIFTTGYMVALRGDGQLFLYGAPPVGPLGSCAIPLPTSYQQIRVTMQGSTIQVYANGSASPCITATNATLWPSGHVDLAASETSARFEYLQIY
jgi:hypothetical protein